MKEDTTIESKCDEEQRADFEVVDYGEHVGLEEVVKLYISERNA